MILHNMVHYSLSMEDYLSHPAIGSSTLKNIMLTPADYKAALEQQSKDTKSTVLGTAIHSLILEPIKFQQSYALQPEDWGPRNQGNGKKMWDAFKKFNEGKICIDFEDAQLLKRIAKAASDHEGLRKILEEAHVEVTAFAEIDGIECKARVDILCEDRIFDLKSDRENLDDENLFKIVFNRGYHFQGAHHTSVISRLEPYTNVKNFGWVFVSTSSPHPHIRIVTAPQELVEWSRRDHAYALRTLKQCMETDKWTGYPTSINELQIPEWARKVYA